MSTEAYEMPDGLLTMNAADAADAWYREASALRSRVEALERTGGIPDEVIDLLDLMTKDAGAHRQAEGIVAACAKAEEAFLAARVKARRVEALEGVVRLNALQLCEDLLEGLEEGRCDLHGWQRRIRNESAEMIAALQPDKGEP